MAPTLKNPNEEEEEEAKARARSDRAQSELQQQQQQPQPGAVSVPGNQAASRLDQRIADKTQQQQQHLHDVAAAAAPLNQLESDIMTKQKECRGPSNKPGAVTSSPLEADIMAKQAFRGSKNSPSKHGAVSTSTMPSALHDLDADIMAKQTFRDNGSGGSPSKPGAFSAASAVPTGKQGGRLPASTTSSTDADRLEEDVLAKQRGRASAAATSLDQKVAAKLRNEGNNTSHSNNKGSSAAGAVSALASFENQVLAKGKVNDGSGGAGLASNGTSSQMQNLEELISAKNSGRTAAPIVTKGSHYDKKIDLNNSADAGKTAVLQKTQASSTEEFEGVHFKQDEKSLLHNSAEKEAQLLASGLQDGLTGMMASQHGIEKNTDLEYGVYGGPDEQGLAVAFAVEEDDDDMFIPAAVEYDPDAKPPIYRNRRFLLYACLAMVVLVVGSVGAVAGILLSDKESTPPALSNRSTIGIREHVERMVGSEQLDDISNPYRKALDWIQDVDPLALTPENKTFTQRFMAAYFHFSTSVKQPWAGGCNAPVDGESDKCVMVSMDDVVSGVAESKDPAMRWLSSADECKWAGVECDEMGHIRSLSFRGTNMTGALPEGLGGFPFLQTLIIQKSRLEGTLPECLGDMKHLITINLKENQFSGAIPRNLYNSRSLQSLILTSNQLTGPIEDKISHFKSMLDLIVTSNLLTGSIPTELGMLSSLWLVQFDNNQFTGSIPTFIGNLKYLESMFFHRNELTGSIPSEIGLLTLLEDFRVSGNRMSGTLPMEAYSIAPLTQFDIKDNKFNGTISPFVGNMTSLFVFQIDNNQFSGTLPAEIGNLKQLLTLSASGNNLTGSVPNSVCKLRTHSGTTKVLEVIQVDCAVPTGGSVPEIACACCTQCCQPDGANCAVVDV